MMELKDNKRKQNSSPLKTEEIINILNNNNNSNFCKSEKLFDNISTSFKKYQISDFAKKENDFEESKKTSEVKNSDKIPTITDENKLDESKQNPHKEILEDKLEVVSEEKKITEAEAKKMADEQSQLSYQKGKNDGIKMIKDELQKGEEAIALALKNTIDNIFFTSPVLLDSLNTSIKKSILEICTDLVGHQIDSLPDTFIKKIESLVESISNATNKTKIFLCKDDFEIVTKYLNKNKTDAEINFSINDSLSRGDIIIKSGGTEIKDILVEKINIPENAEISKDLLKLEKKNEVENKNSFNNQVKDKNLENNNNKTQINEQNLNKIEENKKSDIENNLEIKSE